MDTSSESVIPNLQPEIPPEIQPKRNNGIIFFLLFIILLLLLVIASLIYYVVRKGNEKVDKSTLQTIVSTPTETPIPKPLGVLFIRDYEVWQKVGDKEEQLTNSSKGVGSFAISPTGNYYATVEGTNKTYPSGNGTYVSPERVVIILRATGSKKTIYELTPKQEDPNSDYELKIRDISFSPDGKLLAITTSDSLYVYDLEKQTTDTIVSNTGPTPTLDVKNPNNGLKDKIYAYFMPVFSPNNDWIFFQEGYYEWSRFVIVNRKTKEQVRLQEYGGGVGGEGFLGWYDNDHVLLTEMAQGGPGGDDLNTKTRVFTYQPFTKAKEEFLLEEGYLYFAAVDKTSIYATKSYSQKELDGVFSYNTFVRIDKASKQITKLFTGQKTKQGEPTEGSFFGSPLINGSQILISFAKPMNHYEVWAFDKDGGENQQPTVISANGLLPQKP